MCATIAAENRRGGVAFVIKIPIPAIVARSLSPRRTLHGLTVTSRPMSQSDCASLGPSIKGKVQPQMAKQDLAWRFAIA